MLTPVGEGRFVDRRDVEYPPGMRLEVAAENLRAPTAIAFADNGIVVAENGLAQGGDPVLRLYRFDGTTDTLYPRRNPLIPDFLEKINDPRRIRGPIGGLLLLGNKLFITHRDERDLGVVTALDMRDYTLMTVVADIPTAGEHSITDLAVHPTSGRLYFGVGSATNSGVVGLDDWKLGWVAQHRTFHDKPATDLRLRGYRFDTDNPDAGWFRGNDVAVTGPFVPFGESAQSADAAVDGKPTAAIYSISPTGGDLRVEAHGIRNPVGLTFNDFGNLFVSNRGMELRGTRPVADDPDAVYRVPLGTTMSENGGTWFGWPDYSADLRPITDPAFAPPTSMLAATGYPELAPLIDHDDSDLLAPDRDTLLRGVFPPTATPAKLDFPPDTEVFRPYRDDLIVPLVGEIDFSTLAGKVVRVEPDFRRTSDFVYNTRRQPSSLINGVSDALEHPIAVRSLDGALYILDVGELREKRGQFHPLGRTGRLYRLTEIPAEPTVPATEPAE
ncbi:MAG: hypothetical protein AAGD32_09445 [Planctomycetota bacterium]